VDELGSRKNLSDSPTDSSEPRVAVSGDHVYVVWLERITEVDRPARVLFRASHNGGKSFGKTRILSSEGGAPTSVNLLAQESRVYVAWGDDGDEGGMRFRASLDHGSSFGSVRELSAPGNAGRPVLAASNNHVYIAWVNGTGDESGDIFFRASHDKGKSFGPLLDLNEDDEIGFVDLVAQGHNVYLVWDDGFSDDAPQIRFRRSTDKGDTFEPIQRLSMTRSRATGPRLAARNDDVYLTWAECEFPDQCEILFRRSMNEGATFGSPVNVSENPGPSVSPQIAVEHDHVYITWMDSTPGNFDIFFRKSDDRGRSFEPELNLSDNPGDSFDQRISAEDDFVRVVWQDATGASQFPFATEVLYRASDDEGDAFTPTVNLSDNPGSSEAPQLATCQDGERVHFVWQDNTPGQFDIFYRRGEAD
jgi:hypothetical protein